MNILEYCERYKISIPKARRQLKDGVLRLDECFSETLLEIRYYLSKGQRLPAAHIAYLIDNPKQIADLGNHAAKAQEQIEDVGNARQEAAPADVAAYIADAAKGDKEAVSILIDWLQSVIPDEPVGHSYLAVRLLLGVPENIRKFDVPRIVYAFMHCRKVESFSPWWRLETVGSRNVTIYQKPKGFDL